jgi:hypothetical protein
MQAKTVHSCLFKKIDCFFVLRCGLIAMTKENWIPACASNLTSLPTTLAGLFLLRFELHSIRSQRESRSLLANPYVLIIPQAKLMGLFHLRFELRFSRSQRVSLFIYKLF